MLFRSVHLRRSFRGVGDPEDAADVVGATWAEAAPRPDPRPTGPSGPGDPLPEVLLQTLDGPLDLADLRGQVVVLNLWATWCAPCRVELPALDALTARLREAGVPVRLVAVSTDASREAWRAALPRLGLDGAVMAHGPALGEALGVSILPTTFLVGPDGVIRHRSTGWEEERLPALEAAIEALAR